MAIKILLVDDDKLFRRSLGFHLERAGYKVYTSANAEDALALARREQLNLILLDIGLPGMDGLAALRHFEQHVGVPVIFVTARRRELDEALGLELAVVYLPFMQELFKTVALPPTALLISLGLSTVVFWGVELEKWFLRTTLRNVNGAVIIS